MFFILRFLVPNLLRPRLQPEGTISIFDAMHVLDMIVNIIVFVKDFSTMVAMLLVSQVLHVQMLSKLGFLCKQFVAHVARKMLF